MGILDNLNDDGKRVLRNTIIDNELATLTKNGIVKINNQVYEELFNDILNKSDYSNGRYTSCETYGNKSICFDLLVEDVIEHKKIAIQIKSINYNNSYIKIYEMSKSTDPLSKVHTAKDVLKTILDIYKSRYDKEKQRYQFDELQSLMLLKAKNTIVFYQNILDLSTISTNEKDYEIVSYIPNKKIVFKDINTKVIFDFGFNNHTLRVKYKKNGDFSFYITSNGLETISEKVKRVMDKVEADKTLNSTLEMPFEVKFDLLKRDKKGLAKLIYDNGHMNLYPTEEIKRVNKTNLMYVNDKNKVYLLANSIINSTSKMYKELLDVGAISKKGRVLKNLRLESERNLRIFK